MVVIDTSQVLSIVIAAIELSVIVLSLVRIRKIIRKYLALRANKVFGLDAFEQSLAAAVPRVVAKMLVLELKGMSRILADC